jgi:uncharacterized protein YegP (UPF0339 family)
MNRYRTEIYKNRGGEWAWRRITNSNGNVVSQGEGYKRRATLKRLLKSMHPSDSVVDLTQN